MSRRELNMLSNVADGDKRQQWEEGDGKTCWQQLTSQYFSHNARPRWQKKNKKKTTSSSISLANVLNWIWFVCYQSFIGFNLLPLGLADRNANDTNFAHAQSRESDIISVDGPRDCFVSFFAEKIKWRIQRAKVEVAGVWRKTLQKHPHRCFQ